MKSELEVIAFDADSAEAQSGHDHPEAPVKASAFVGIFAWPEQSCGNQSGKQAESDRIPAEAGVDGDIDRIAAVNDRRACCSMTLCRCS
jgi:hypothetical protein